MASDMNVLTQADRFLVQAGHRAPCADNLQPWHFNLLGSGLSVTCDHLGSANDPRGHATLLAMGAMMENMVQAAKAADLDIIPQLLLSEDACFSLRYNRDAPILPSARDHIVFKRHTNRAPYKTRPLSHHVVTSLSSIRESSAQVEVLVVQRQIEEISRLTELASQARFQTRELHEWLLSSLRFSPRDVDRGDGLDVDSLVLPPGGKSLLKLLRPWNRLEKLNQFGAHKLLAKLEGMEIKKAPAVIVVNASNTREEIFAAGRAMERAWLLANECCIAVHPYYVVPDQLQRETLGIVPRHLSPLTREVSKAITKLLGGGNRSAHMILRVGYPTRQAIRSRRRPLESVCQE